MTLRVKHGGKKVIINVITIIIIVHRGEWTTEPSNLYYYY